MTLKREFARDSSTHAAALLLLFVWTSSVGAQNSCVGSFDAGVFPLCGIDGSVYAAANFDDGTGEALFVGGNFRIAGSLPTWNVARWNGSAWSAVGNGLPNAIVYALAVHDDGSGPRLYAATQSSVVRWDGQFWSSVGGVFSSPFGLVSVRALAVYDSGSGPMLYAGGYFGQVGGIPAAALARWNGSTWSDVGGITSGFLHGTVRALAAHDDGSGAKLLIGGGFTAAGGVPTASLARYDGSVFSAFGGLAPYNQTAPWVFAFATGDVGAGPELFVGGGFSAAGSVAAADIARWNGTAWSPLGSGIAPISVLNGGAVTALAVHDDGGGPKLFAGGFFHSVGGVTTRSIARWNGASWGAVGDSEGIRGTVDGLIACDLGGGSRLCVFGNFGVAGEAFARSIAAWNGTTWSAINDGLSTSLDAFAVYDDGNGPALYASNVFPSGFSTRPAVVRRWNGSSWILVGGLFDGPITALETLTLPNGTFLAASGTFTQVGGSAANQLALWDGVAWQPRASPGGEIVDFQSFDDGSGTQVYAVGSFPGLIARWSGSSWSPLGAGLAGTGNAAARALEVFDDGTGPALYVGGTFTSAGGIPAASLARWQAGGTWSPVGSGVDSVYDLQVHRDADREVLFVGGHINVPGSLFPFNLARYGPAGTWYGVIVPSSTPALRLLSHDDGAGPALYVGTTSTNPTKALSRYYAVGSTSMGSLEGGSQVSALASFDDGGGPALWIGGDFLKWGTTISAKVARWRRPAPFTLSLSQPFGAGSIRIAPQCGGALRTVFTAISMDPANAAQPGAGTWFGLHLSLDQVTAQYLTQLPPFEMQTDSMGAAEFSLPEGSLPPFLSGMTFWASSHVFSGVLLGLGGTLVGETPVESITLL